jgi:hypothetical protein
MYGTVKMSRKKICLWLTKKTEKNKLMILQRRKIWPYSGNTRRYITEHNTQCKNGRHGEGGGR